MEITLELVDRLRKRANVSYEEAKAVLEEAEGNLLDALILLEQRGKIRSDGGESAHYSTKSGEETAPPSPEPQAQSWEKEEQGGVWSHIGRALTENRFEIWRRGVYTDSIPLIIFILLVVLAFWITLPLLVIGLLCGFRYRFAGPDFDDNAVSQAVNHAADAVGDAMERVRAEAEQAAHKKQSKQ
ncbi:hypothetical protein B5G34_17425 [Flavonifractor sp. An82]|uniref:hypothetical protein n=1 Tax=Flavonifractor sp. An82 TaxID=1965660 RepID=UPI000B387C22|nr:hypothetical protein [Flavonifractor sp. An82]OUN19403.1 hypothetical protein B5G34_17425 [Flavonifractor sp. An82]